MSGRNMIEKCAMEEENASKEKERAFCECQQRFEGDTCGIRI